MKDDAYESIVAFLDELEALGCAPRHHTYFMLLQFLKRNKGSVFDIKALFERMTSKMKPDAFACKDSSD